MLPIRTGFVLLSFLVVAPVGSDSASLDTAQWRADLDQLNHFINETHPRPFRSFSREAFRTEVDRLNGDIPALDDREIVVRMAALVARLRDGHTRLTIPRMHPEGAVRPGHSGNEPPNVDGLALSRLPVTFRSLDDGLFIVAATGDHRGLIGSKVVRIGTMPAARALQAAGTVVSAENAGYRDMMAADRLSLPTVLSVLGIAENGDDISIEVLTPSDDARRDVLLSPMTPGRADRETAIDETRLPLSRRASDREYWFRYLENEGIVYLRIDEIANVPDYPIAGTVRDAVATAEEEDARLVIDLRHNFGGSGTYNRSIVLGLVKSRELNRYGRAFVLIGPRTFSAAQLLVNELERYSRAIFVGEPTGSRPDHFGDSRKVRLDHSGLTLRVSSLHWSSWRSNDDRDATRPLIPAPFSSETWFSHADPALAAVAAHPGTANAVDLFGKALETVGEQKAARFLLGHYTSPDSVEDDLVEDLRKLGERFEENGKTDLAGLTYRYGLFFHPGNAELQRSLSDVSD